MITFSLGTNALRPIRSTEYKYGFALRANRNITILPNITTIYDTNISFKHNKQCHIECVLNNFLLKNEIQLERKTFYIIDNNTLKLYFYNPTENIITIKQNEIFCELVHVTDFKPTLEKILNDDIKKKVKKQNLNNINKIVPPINIHKPINNIQPINNTPPPINKHKSLNKIEHKSVNTKISVPKGNLVRTRLDKKIKSDVKTEVKTELKNDTKEVKTNVKTELKNDVKDVKTELKNDAKEVKNDVKTELKSDIKEVKTEVKTELKNDAKEEVKEKNKKDIKKKIKEEVKK